MGNIFPQIYSLREKPSLFQETITLIEKSFHYSKENSFAIDFYPLVEKNNHENCYILIDENEKVIGHIGTKTREMIINSKSFLITMIGGIAISEEERGKGYFQKLFQHALSEKKSDSSFFLLWSDQEKLYSKYGFILCGHQYESEIKNSISSLEKTKFSLLNDEEKKQVRRLFENYFSRKYHTFRREESNWIEIEMITSSDIFIKRVEGEISAYFFQNKGEDLTNSIFEFGLKVENENLLELSPKGKIWTATPNLENDIEQFQFMLAPGDLTLFKKFVFEFTNQKIEILNINQMKQEIIFSFNNENLALSLDEFIQGIFGPKYFEELSEIKPIFISGLDSI